MISRKKLARNSYGMTGPALLGAILIIVILVVGGVLLFHKSSGGLSKSPYACVNQGINLTSSRKCVSDVQNLLNWNLYGIDQPNYMMVNGQFSATTTAAISKVQSNSGLTANGKMNLATWKVLCQGTDAPSWWTNAAQSAGCTS